MVRDRKRPVGERISTGIVGILALVAFLFVPGLAPIRGALGARRVDGLCAHYWVGSPIDDVDFKQRAEELGLTVIVSAKKHYAHAHAAVFLRGLRICDIQFANGRVTKLTLETHAP
jgi:hypothetical protein